MNLTHNPPGRVGPPPLLTRLDSLTSLPPCQWEGKVVTVIFIIIDTYIKFAIYLPYRKEINTEDLTELFYS